MTLNELLDSFNLGFETIKNKFRDDFQESYNAKKDWLCNLEDKVSRLNSIEDRNDIISVIEKLKDDKYKFSDNDLGYLRVSPVVINESGNKGLFFYSLIGSYSQSWLILIEKINEKWQVMNRSVLSIS